MNISGVADATLLGLVAQTCGIGLLAVLAVLLGRSMDRRALRYWSAAWAARTMAFASLLVAFLVPAARGLFFPLYLLGGYTFGYLFLAGCRNQVSHTRLTSPSFWLLVPGVVVAAALTRLSGGDAVVAFIPHAAIMAYFFLAAFRTLRPARRRGQAGMGIRMLSTALLLLALTYLHYVPVFAVAALDDMTLPVAYQTYASLLDLFLEILLGFGTLTVVMEDVRRELETTNVELMSARDRLEVMARSDPLTESLNRHAFYSLVEPNRDPDAAPPLHGCVALIDIDDLKHINDSHGHAKGDLAIRAVARAIRSLVRADDLLFRWGGDEFLILLFGVSEREARARLGELNGILARTVLPEAEAPIAISVSYGLASFSGNTELDRIIDQADGAMYAMKNAK